MLSTLPAVAQAGFDILVAAPDEGPLMEALKQQGVPNFSLSITDSNGQRRALEDLREHLAMVFRSCKPDLIHSNSLSMGRVAGPVVAEQSIPGVAHLRDIIKLSRAAIRDLNCHDRLLAVSQATRDFHIRQGLLGEKTEVLYNGVDLQRFRPRPSSGYLHHELGLSGDAMLLGAIGQIGLRKGFDVLLSAAERIVRREPAAHVVILGARFSEKAESREFEARLIERSQTGSLAGHVHFLGIRSDVDRLLAELSLLVHPARQEPLGRVLLEAAAAGVPIVATDVGGTREIFPPESGAARLVPVDDPERLADDVVQLLQDQVQREQLGVAARDRAETQFDLKRASRGLIEQYQEVLQRN